MPNYSKTIIYKICCKDTTITDIYIGSTCNFNRRKYAHKNDCNNEKQKKYNLKVYQFIRDNGDWNQWDMIQIKEFSCENKREKETEERKYIEELKPTLNCIIPTRSKKEWFNDNKEKIKKQKKEYYENNKRKIIENIKKYNLNNKEKVNEYHKDYVLNNKEKLKKYKKEYVLENKEKIKKQMKKYRLENKEKIKLYKLENKEKIKEYQKEYREKKKKY